jgi:hypothetical protein
MEWTGIRLNGTFGVILYKLTSQSHDWEPESWGLLLLNQSTQSLSRDAKSSSVPFRVTDLVNRIGSSRAVMPGVMKAKVKM